MNRTSLRTMGLRGMAALFVSITAILLLLLSPVRLHAQTYCPTPYGGCWEGGCDLYLINQRCMRSWWCDPGEPVTCKEWEFAVLRQAPSGYCEEICSYFIDFTCQCWQV